MRSTTLLCSSLLALFALGCSGGKTSGGIDALAVSPSSLMLVAGSRRALEVSPVCSGACVLPSALEWTSSDPSVASVDARGTITAYRRGTAMISALDPASGAVGEATVVIGDAGIRKLTIQMPYPLPVGTYEQLDAVGTFDDGATRDVSAKLQWTSSAPAVVSVDEKGIATARSIGHAVITARDTTTGAIASTAFAVTDAVLQSIDLSPGSANLAVGSSRTLAARGRFTDGTTHELAVGLSWSSSDSSIATVDATGVVRAVAPGTITVSAGLGEIARGFATLVVSP